MHTKLNTNFILFFLVLTLVLVSYALPATAYVPLTVESVNGSPSIFNVHRIKFKSGTKVTDLKNGAVLIASNGNVSAGATIADNRLVRGDGGAQGIQGSGITVDDSDNITGVVKFTASGTIIGAVVNGTTANFTNTLTGSFRMATSASNGYLLSSNGGGLGTWKAPSTLALAGGSNTQFQFNNSGALGGNGALTFTKASKTLAVASDAPLDINSTSVSIADTDISLDGASTTFTQTTGGITMAPASGSDFNITTAAATGDFAVNTSELVVNGGGLVGIGVTSPNQLLTVNGVVAVKETSAPSATSTFGKIYANSSNSKLYFQDDGGTSYNLLNGATASLTDATTLDTIDSTSFLRSDTSDSFTSGTLTLDAGTTFDVNSTAVSIADTDISLDGASTTFTQTTGAITMAPASGTDFNITTAAATGDFAVNTSELVVNGGGFVGIGTTTPGNNLVVKGTNAKVLLGDLNRHTTQYTGFDSQNWTLLELVRNGTASVSGLSAIAMTSNISSPSTTDDAVGGLIFVNKQLAASERRMGMIFVGYDAANSGRYDFWTMNSGNLGRRMSLSSAGTLSIDGLASASTKGLVIKGASS